MRPPSLAPWVSRAGSARGGSSAERGADWVLALMILVTLAGLVLALLR